MAGALWQRLAPVLRLAGWSAVLALLIGLSLWQLRRAAEKTQMIAAFAQAQANPGQPAPDADTALLQAGNAVVFVRTCVTGRYDGGRQFLLEGQVQEGRAGLHVWTPLIRQAGPPVVVDRGWVAQDARRAPMEAIEVDGAERTACGLLVRFPRSGWRLPAPPATAWPRSVVYPDPGDLEAALASPVYPLLLLLDRHAPDGFQRQWQPVALGPERHYGYAVQWAGLAVTWVIATIAYRRRHRRATDR